MSDNPYVTPGYAHYPVDAILAEPVISRPKGLGAFVLAVMIMDIVFCAFRIVLVPWGMFVFSTLEPNSFLYGVVLAEIPINAGMGLVGILSDALILAKLRIGVFLAAASVLFRVSSIIVGILEAGAMLPVDLGTPEGVGAVFGLGFVVLVRCALLVLYVAALVVASKRLAMLRPGRAGWARTSTGDYLR